MRLKNSLVGVLKESFGDVMMNQAAGTEFTEKRQLWAIMLLATYPAVSPQGVLLYLLLTFPLVCSVQLHSAEPGSPLYITPIVSNKLCHCFQLVSFNYEKERNVHYVAAMWYRYSNSMPWIIQKSPNFKYSILFVRPRIMICNAENKVTLVRVAL